MSAVSEFARQLHQAIVGLGYTSPEKTWEGLEILNELRITSGKSYGWLRELEKAGLTIRIPASSIQGDDRFYAVPTASLVPSFRETPAHDLRYQTPKTKSAIHRTDARFDWTKWGTILTGLGIVVAIALWKYS